MGVLRPHFRYTTAEDIVASITAGTSTYYAFASQPSLLTGNVTPATLDDYSSIYENNWNLLFGKKIANTDVAVMIRHIPWTANTVYTRYDDRDDTLANNDFYVVVPPGYDGGFYHVYKCIDNANNANSTQQPDVQEPSTFQLADGYQWRYIYSISYSNYSKFGTADYVPVTPNNTIVVSAGDYAGIDVVKIANAGMGYETYHDGTVQSVSNSTLVKIENTASTFNDYYANSAIYLFNNVAATSQLATISSYESNSSGRWVFLSEEINTDYVNPLVTEYSIAPRVFFETDGDEAPLAYATINTVANSIGSVTIVEPGSGVSRATATIVCNTAYGSGANLICIIPPPGGHGANPADELDAVALGVTFSFVKSESNTIPTTNTTYNKIGIYKNPYDLSNTGSKGTILYTANTFDQRLQATLTPTMVTPFSKDDIVIGLESGARGKVTHSNTTSVHLVGDKTFANNEIIETEDGSKTATINISTRGVIYAKDLIPIYAENINDVTRTADQSETFRLIIQV